MKLFRKLIVSTFLLGMFIFANALFAKSSQQDATVCPVELGCVDVSLPPGQVGDFLVDGAPVLNPDGTPAGVQVNVARLLVAPGVAHVVSVQNVVNPDPASGFGDLFVYAPVAPANVTVQGGQARAVAFRTTQQFLKGTVNFTCDIRGLQPGQDVSCAAGLDPAALTPVPAGTTLPFNLPVGAQILTVNLAGVNADLWAPATQAVKVNVVGGRPANAKASFDRKGQLNLMLNNAPGAVADFYVDGVLVASQVPSASVFVAPGNHAVAAMMITDPAANGAYAYADVSGNGNAGANQTRDVKLTPKKVFLVGNADVNCKINGFAPGLDASCDVLADGNPIGNVPAGQKASFPLPNGPHVVTVKMAGANADLWAPTSQDFPVNIIGGRGVPVNTNFNRKGILVINFSDPTVVGDILVNGEQVGTQVNSVQITVEPNKPVAIVGQNIINPANDALGYAPVSANATVSANQTKNVVLKLGGAVERCTSSMYFLSFRNDLPTRIGFVFVGPDETGFVVEPGQTVNYCLRAGTYLFVYSDAVDSGGNYINLPGGVCEGVSWGVKVQAIPCSNNPNDYQRPPKGIPSSGSGGGSSTRQ
ncbi:MAG TPA: hypothetical protein PK299_08735 [Anaerolineales bacterium]|nr:hypothetical protein [Anaerolineales bacterium]